MTETDRRIDRVIMAILWIAVLAITFSASAITWSIARTAQMAEKVDHLEESVDLLDVRYTNLKAYLEARGVRLE